MKKWKFGVVAGLLMSLVGNVVAAAHNEGAVPRPKLVVGVVIDQMRWDYLYRFYDLYGEDGFRRLLHQGASCQNTTIDYLPSFTAPGHSCIYTGSVPAIHGIAANDWVDVKTGRQWYCTEDTLAHGVGTNGKEGKMSPRNLWASTITDELKLATNGQSKVFGISLKDRASILPAGHAANGAYWFSINSGNFISSDFYVKTLPDWIVQFNQRKVADSLLNLNWNLLLPQDKYTQSTADDVPYEGIFNGEKAPVFPHHTAAWAGKTWKYFPYTPFGNTIVRMLAESCIEHEKLGQADNETDFLAVSFSSTDYVGHYFGPNSMEIEDEYLRLDQDLAHLLHYLDQKVGEGNYTLFLTADHGGAHNAGFLTDQKIPGGVNDMEQEVPALNKVLKAKFNVDSLVTNCLNYQVFFNPVTIKKTNEAEVKAVIRQWFENKPEVAFVIDLNHPETSPVPASIMDMVKNGYNRERSGSLQVIYKPGWYSDRYKTGTTHGTWNPYDIHIPLIWYGWGIKTGAVNRETHMTDISATLATLLHIQQPNGCMGKVITEVIR